MGKKKRGSNKMGGAAQLKNAVSDDDEGGPALEAAGLYDDVDNWDMQQDKLLIQALFLVQFCGSGRFLAESGSDF
jgi:hypothetical protein